MAAAQKWSEADVQIDSCAGNELIYVLARSHTCFIWRRYDAVHQAARADESCWAKGAYN